MQSLRGICGVLCGIISDEEIARFAVTCVCRAGDHCKSFSLILFVNKTGVKHEAFHVYTVYAASVARFVKKFFDLFFVFIYAAARHIAIGEISERFSVAVFDREVEIISALFEIGLEIFCFFAVRNAQFGISRNVTFRSGFFKKLKRKLSVFFEILACRVSETEVIRCDRVAFFRALIQKLFSEHELFFRTDTEHIAVTDLKKRVGIAAGRGKLKIFKRFLSAYFRPDALFVATRETVAASCAFAFCRTSEIVERRIFVAGDYFSSLADDTHLDECGSVFVLRRSVIAIDRKSVVAVPLRDESSSVKRRSVEFVRRLVHISFAFFDVFPDVDAVVIHLTDNVLACAASSRSRLAEMLESSPQTASDVWFAVIEEITHHTQTARFVEFDALLYPSVRLDRVFLGTDAETVASRYLSISFRVSGFRELQIEIERAFLVFFHTPAALHAERKIKHSDFVALSRGFFKPVNCLGKILFDRVAFEEAEREITLRVAVAFLCRGHEIVTCHERILLCSETVLVAIRETVFRLIVALLRKFGIKPERLRLVFRYAFSVQIEICYTHLCVDTAEVSRFYVQIHRAFGVLLATQPLSVQVGKFDLGFYVACPGCGVVILSRLDVIVLYAESFFVHSAQIISAVAVAVAA